VVEHVVLQQHLLGRRENGRRSSFDLLRTTPRGSIAATRSAGRYDFRPATVTKKPVTGGYPAPPSTGERWSTAGGRVLVVAIGRC